MKKLLAFAVAASLFACSKLPVQTASYDVIPQPQEVVADENADGFTLSGSTVIAYPADMPALKTDAGHLRDYILQMTGHTLKITENAPAENVINLRADLESDNPEGYVMTVNAASVDINGATPAGTFYGIQTLRKSIPEALKSNVVFPAATITDEPRFAYRGAHFDVARHFFPTDSVKAFIDMIALHNINTFHWHLTDDQGWRIEIKSRPLLTELGSERPGTIIGHTNEYDSIPVKGFYTQDQIKEIIDYAADRHITVIPEIDLPGHMLAALHAYPSLGCTGGPYDVWRRWGVAEEVLCAGNDSTYAFLDDVLGEVADLFPAEYFHIGGDECPKVSWEKCPKCQAKIVELGLKTDGHSTKEQKLQSHVMKHAGDFLASRGKKVIGWDEILEGGLAPGSIVMSWRGEEGGLEAARQGHDAIMTPSPFLYFDYYQTLDHKDEPVAIGGYIPLEKVYGYEPVNDKFTPEEAAHIIGVQANLWTEYIKTFGQVQYMELPRMAALSEMQWSTAPKDYDAFLKRVPRMMNHYRANGYNYSTRAFDLKSDISTDPEKNAVIIELTSPDGAPVYYTLDGTEPTTESTLYEAPVSLTESAVIKAVAVRPIDNSHLYSDSVSFSKSTARPITLETNPAKRYAANGAQTLVDGILGGEGYSSSGWMGFNGSDLVAVIDLQQPATISNVDIHTTVATGAWVFDTRGIKIEISDDGKSWTTAASEQYPPVEEATNALSDHFLCFEPVDTRYVRVTVESEKSIPAWHTGKGKPAFVFVDEIAVN